MTPELNESFILATARDLARDLAYDDRDEQVAALVKLTAHLIGLSSMYDDDPELVTALVLGTSR